MPFDRLAMPFDKLAYLYLHTAGHILGTALSPVPPKPVFKKPSTTQCPPPCPKTILYSNNFRRVGKHGTVKPPSSTRNFFYNVSQ